MIIIILFPSIYPYYFIMQKLYSFIPLMFSTPVYATGSIAWLPLPPPPPIKTNVKVYDMAALIFKNQSSARTAFGRLKVSNYLFIVVALRCAIVRDIVRVFFRPLSNFGFSKFVFLVSVWLRYRRTAVAYLRIQR